MLNECRPLSSSSLSSSRSRFKYSPIALSVDVAWQSHMLHIGRHKSLQHSVYTLNRIMYKYAKCLFIISLHAFIFWTIFIIHVVVHLWPFFFLNHIHWLTYSLITFQIGYSIFVWQYFRTTCWGGKHLDTEEDFSLSSAPLDLTAPVKKVLLLKYHLILCIVVVSE